MFKTLADNRNFLSSQRFLNYFKIQVKSALKLMKYQIPIKGIRYQLNEKRHTGPVFTLELQSKTRKFCVSLDLAPCFLMQGWYYPTGGYRENPYFQYEFFVVPKCIKCKQSYRHRYWRLSLPKHEKKLINNLNQIKPTIRLLKYIRDRKGQQKISSYSIKNMVLCDLIGRTAEENFEIWSAPLSYCLMRMLKLYAVHLHNGHLSYYWNMKFNLLGDIDELLLRKYEDEINEMIEDIEWDEDPDVILAHLD